MAAAALRVWSSPHDERDERRYAISHDLAPMASAIVAVTSAALTFTPPLLTRATTSLPPLPARTAAARMLLDPAAATTSMLGA